MRRWIQAVVMMAAMGATMTMRAQIITDPTTGMMVDGSTDPSGYAIASSDAAIYASQQMVQQMQQQMQDQQNAQMQAQQQADAQAFADFVNSAQGNNNDTSDAVEAPAVPKTPKPVLTPNGGSFKGGSVQVSVTDADPQAQLLVSTDGKTYADYTGPITVTAKKMTVRVKAVADGEAASALVKKTFKVKT